jgi:phenylacetate-CoA ligase
MAKLGSPGVKIFNVYGFTEAKRPWMETADAEDSRFATYPDMEVFEIIDPDTGKVVPDGEPGEVVYTHLSGAGSVVLRYRTGDRVREGLVYGRCPHTGLELPLLGTGLHRVSEIKKVKETLVDFNAMFSFFNSRQEIVEWQVVVRKQGEDGFGRDEILLRVALKDGTDETEFRESIAGNFRQLTEVSIDDVEFMGREELSELLGLESQAKESRIVDERDN